MRSCIPVGCPSRITASPSDHRSGLHRPRTLQQWSRNWRSKAGEGRSCQGTRKAVRPSSITPSRATRARASRSSSVGSRSSSRGVRGRRSERGPAGGGTRRRVPGGGGGRGTGGGGGGKQRRAPRGGESQTEGRRGVGGHAEKLAGGAPRRSV